MIPTATRPGIRLIEGLLGILALRICYAPQTAYQRLAPRTPLLCIPMKLVFFQTYTIHFYQNLRKIIISHILGNIAEYHSLVKVVEGEAWSGTVDPAGLAVSGEDIAAMTVAEVELAGCMSVDSVE